MNQGNPTMLSAGAAPPEIKTFRDWAFVNIASPKVTYHVYYEYEDRLLFVPEVKKVELHGVDITKDLEVMSIEEVPAFDWLATEIAKQKQK